MHGKDLFELDINKSMVEQVCVKYHNENQQKKVDFWQIEKNRFRIKKGQRCKQSEHFL